MDRNENFSSLDLQIAVDPAFRRWMLVGSWSTIAVLAGIDFCTQGINLATLYTIPAFFIAHTIRTRSAVVACLILIILSYAGLFIGPRPAGLDAAELIHNFRMVNRTLSAAAICAVFLLIAGGMHFRRRTFLRLEQRRFTLKDARIYLDLLDRLEVQRVVLISIIVIISLAVTDFESPRELNLPILYAVPLILCATSRSIRAIWGMLPVVVLLAWAGFHFGPTTSDVQERAGSLMWVNRTVATGVMVMLTIVATIWIRATHAKLPAE